MNQTAFENLALAAFGAVGVVSVWSLFDKRIYQWMIDATLSVAFVAFAFVQEALALRWASLAVAAAGVVVATIRFRRDRRSASTSTAAMGRAQ